MEVLLHYSARDRSVLTIQSDLLGAHALGVRNVLALTRDTPQYSTVPEADTSEVDAIGLVNLVSNLNRGLDVGANPLGVQTAYLVGVNVNPYAPNPEEEFRRFQFKVDAGADFAVTQPVFEVDQLARFLERARSFAPHVHIIAGICPLTSFRNAEFMNNEVPGISVPAAVMERMRAADSGERARQEGLKIAQETLAGNPFSRSGSADRCALRPIRHGGGGGAGARRQPDGHSRPSNMIEFVNPPRLKRRCGQAWGEPSERKR